MKAGLVPGKTPARVLEALADGDRYSIRSLCEKLGGNVHEQYGNVAQTLTVFAQAGKIKREKVRGRFVYWRDDVMIEAVA